MLQKAQSLKLQEPYDVYGRCLLATVRAMIPKQQLYINNRNIVCLFQPLVLRRHALCHTPDMVVATM